MCRQMYMYWFSDSEGNGGANMHLSHGMGIFVLKHGLYLWSTSTFMYCLSVKQES